MNVYVTDIESCGVRVEHMMSFSHCIHGGEVDTTSGIANAEYKHTLQLDRAKTS